MSRKIEPDWWQNQLLSLKEAIYLFESVYQETMSEVIGSRLRWVKLASCKDEKKRRRYVKVILIVLRNLCVLFGEDVVFTKEGMRKILMDFIRCVYEWYRKLFTFLRLGTDTAMEVFERWIVENYGSVERYARLFSGITEKDKRKIKVDIKVSVDDLRKVEDFYTF